MTRRTQDGEDLIDLAQRYESMERDYLIQSVVNRNKNYVVHSTGYCYECKEPVSMGQRWCDADCRDTYLKKSFRGV